MYLKNIFLPAGLVALRSKICYLLVPLSEGHLRVLLGCDVLDLNFLNTENIDLSKKKKKIRVQSIEWELPPVNM